MRGILSIVSLKIIPGLVLEITATNVLMADFILK